jgi:hypothetical protein
VGGKGAVEFLEFGFDDLRDCRDIKVIVGKIKQALDSLVRRRHPLVTLTKQDFLNSLV